MKSAAFFILMTLILACTTNSQRTPASFVKPRHLIVTVPGLPSHKAGWGDFHPVIKQALEKIDPNFEVTLSALDYSPEESLKSSYAELIEKLDSHIRSEFQSRPLQANDRISLIGHSQGGVISFLWLFSRLSQASKHQSFAKQVNSIITLSTPFWGSKLASLAVEKNVAGFADEPSIKRELENSALGSESSYALRNILMELDSNPEWKKRLEAWPVRFLNINAVLPLDKITGRTQGPLSSLLRRDGFAFEADLPIQAPNARWNFIYAPTVEVKSDLSISVSQFRSLPFSDRSSFALIESPHRPFDFKGESSLPYVPATCLDLASCKHPALGTILEHLANCKKNICNSEQSMQIIQRLKSFSQDLPSPKPGLQKLHQSFNIQIAIKTNAKDFSSWSAMGDLFFDTAIDLKRDKNQKSEGSNSLQQIFIGRKSEAKSTNVIFKPATRKEPFDQMRLLVTGQLQSINERLSSATVPLEIRLPNHPKVSIDAMIRPGYSTFLELDFRK